MRVFQPGSGFYDGDVVINVVVADDHPIFRGGVVRAINEDRRLALAGEATNGRDALALVRQTEPHVAVLDVRMPYLDGLAVLERIVADGLPTRVVMLSAYTDAALVHQAIAAGAKGFLPKETEDAELCSALVRTAVGELVVAPELHAAVLAEIHQPVRSADPVLSERERDVLDLIAQGKSSAEIGVALSLSQGTVKTYLGRLYEKLGVDERAAAVAEGMRRGLIK